MKASDTDRTVSCMQAGCTGCWMWLVVTPYLSIGAFLDARAEAFFGSLLGLAGLTVALAWLRGGNFIGVLICEVIWVGWAAISLAFMVADHETTYDPFTYGWLAVILAAAGAVFAAPGLGHIAHVCWTSEAQEPPAA